MSEGVAGVAEGATGNGLSPSPTGRSGELASQLATDGAGKSWISQTYGGVILFEDLTPNLGLWWCAYTLAWYAWETKQPETCFLTMASCSARLHAASSFRNEP